jgi:tRNA (cytidine32/uridine32-2'-O)-methyltransferase
MVEPSHPGNIGAAARAMKNMGLSNLHLVEPPSEYDGEVARVRSSGAEDILENAKVFASLDEAISGAELVFGASARQRTLDRPCLLPRESAEMIAAKPHRVAMVFGRESSGLSNSELLRCHYHVHIPSIESFSSLNLSQAIQVIAYELRVAHLDTDYSYNTPKEVLATTEKVEGFYKHLESTLNDLDILVPGQSETLLSRFRLMFNRAEMQDTEVNIMRGFLSAIEKTINPNRPRGGKAQ